MLLLKSIQQQLLCKILYNKLAVRSTTNTLLKNQTFVADFLIEGYEYPFLKKEQLIAPFVKPFKAAIILRKLFTIKEATPLVFNAGDHDLTIIIMVFVLRSVKFEFRLLQSDMTTHLLRTTECSSENDTPCFSTPVKIWSVKLLPNVIGFLYLFDSIT